MRTLLLCTTLLLTVNSAASVSTLLLVNSAADNYAAMIKSVADVKIRMHTRFVFIEKILCISYLFKRLYSCRTSIVNRVGLLSL